MNWLTSGSRMGIIVVYLSKEKKSHREEVLCENPGIEE